jgi:hypothetical protein
MLNPEGLCKVTLKPGGNKSGGKDKTVDQIGNAPSRNRGRPAGSPAAQDARRISRLLLSSAFASVPQRSEAGGGILIFFKKPSCEKKRRGITRHGQRLAWPSLSLLLPPSETPGRNKKKTRTLNAPFEVSKGVFDFDFFSILLVLI